MTDFVIVGAGFAGLAAARRASQLGASAIVLEARGRIGGRVFPLDDPDLPVPIELGAEWIHGRPPVSFDLVRSAGTTLVDSGGVSLVFRNGAVTDRDDPFEQAATVLQRAAELDALDMTVDAFLQAHAGDPAVARGAEATRLMVSGFDAADPARASLRALVDEWSDTENGQTSRSFRPVGGYGPLLRHLCAAIDPQHVAVYLRHAVTTIRRHRDGVEVIASSPLGERTVTARAAIVTLPVGVISAPAGERGAVTFDPPLPPHMIGALDQIVMGPVQKMVLRFRSAFWETVIAGKYHDAGFFHDPDAMFPTMWNLVPLRAPLLTAWAGGPAAHRIATTDNGERLRNILATLDRMFGADARDELDAFYHHDWQADPFARGAYSYVAAGPLENPRAAFAEPVDDVLYFAGEATSTNGEAGTVAGALETGIAAVERALARNWA